MQQHTDATQVIAALKSHSTMLEGIAKATERTNELLFAMLTPEQRQTVHSSGVARLAKSHLEAPEK